MRVPRENLLGEWNGGFAIGQARLGPGRIHHCMRAIGMAERAYDLMCVRVQERVAFGKPLAAQGVVQEWIAESRIRIEQARLLVLKAAWLMDTVGNRGAAAEHFIDFWMGEGAWHATPESRRTAIEAAVVNVQGWGRALFAEPTPLKALNALTMPVLLMVGKNSPASGRAVAGLLAQALPRVETLEFEGLGHMGPVTHPEVVNPAIEEFLRRNAAA